MYTVYSKENCPSCVTAKALLKAKGIDFEVKMAGVDYDVEYLRELGVRQLPYITKDGEVIGGLEELKKQLFK